MARIVLDAGAEAHLGQQLEVVHRALFESLSLQQPILGAEELETLLQLGADVAHRDFHPVRGRHVMRRRVDRDALQLANHLAAQRIDFVQRLDLVAEELDSYRALLFVGRKNLDRVAAHPERPAMKIVVVALILDVHQLAQHLVAVDSLPLFEEHQHLEIDLGLAEAVDARD